jgi:hypothetical protein
MNFHVVSASEPILLALKNYFGVGEVYSFTNKTDLDLAEGDVVFFESSKSSNKQPPNSVNTQKTYYRYMVTKQNEIRDVIGNHVAKYPLSGKKAADFSLLNEILDFLAEKQLYAGIDYNMRKEIEKLLEAKKANFYLK